MASESPKAILGGPGYLCSIPSTKKGHTTVGKLQAPCFMREKQYQFWGGQVTARVASSQFYEIWFNFALRTTFMPKAYMYGVAGQHVLIANLIKNCIGSNLFHVIGHPINFLDDNHCSYDG